MSVEHPGRNEELTERYALGRLSPPERRAFEEHLRGCAECRASAGEELRLAAGIRAAGREEIRLRLRRRLAQNGRAEGVPWPRVMAIAASLLVLAGIGVVHSWLTDTETVGTPPTVVESREAMQKAKPMEAAPGAPPSPDLASGERDRGGRTGSPSIGLYDKEMKHREDGRRVGESGIAGMKSTRPEGVSARKDVVPQEPARDVASQQHAEEELLRGEVLPSQGGVMSEVSAGAARAADALEMKTDVRMKNEKMTAQPSATMERRITQGVRLQQMAKRGVAQTPQTQQHRRREMEALVRRTQDGITVTLYPDTPFTQSALDAGRAEFVSPESLRVLIGGETIIYRLSPRLQQNPPVR